MLYLSQKTFCRIIPRYGYRHYTTTKAATTANPLRASFLRGGTSKGVFINSSDLPTDKSLWKPIFLGLMGSPDPIYGRQLNGMGGGVSSLSKICVVGRPSAGTNVKIRETYGTDETVDVEYTFVQVGIKDDSIDLSGNCGNLSAMIGAFALDEGLVTAPSSISRDVIESSTLGDIRTATVRSFNTNTNKLISTTFPVAMSSAGDHPSNSKGLVTPVLDLPQTSMAGVPGKASQIILQFHDPAGARTGKLLPTGKPIDSLAIRLPPLRNTPSKEVTVSASLVDATNPTVFVSYSELASELGLPLEDYIAGKQPSADYVSAVLESIRQEGAKAMGLDPSAQAQPKIAILSSPSASNTKVKEEGNATPDIVIHALSMGVLHKAVPMTVGLCLGVASKVQGTIAWNVQGSKQTRSSASDNLVCILHPGGLVEVGAEFDEVGNVKSAQVVRTGRRLMVGKVFW